MNGGLPISLAEQIAYVKRDIRARERILVLGMTTPKEAEADMMRARAVLATLKGLERFYR